MNPTTTNPTQPSKQQGASIRPAEFGFLLLTALIMRIGVLFFVISQFKPSWLFTKGLEMTFLAQSILHGEGFSSPFGGHTGPSALVGPVYPLLVATVFRIFGAYSDHAAIAILLLQVSVSLLNLWLIVQISERLGGRCVALLAGVLWSVAPPLLWMPTIFWDTTFTTCLVTAVVYLGLVFIDNPSRKRLLLTSAFLGSASLVNPALLPLSFVTTLWLSMCCPRQRRSNLLLAIAILALTFSPWPIRNAITLHSFVPMRSTVGLELWMGNHEGSTGHLEETLFPIFNSVELEKYKRSGEVAYDHEKTAIAISYIESHPIVFTSLTLQRIGRYWTGTGSREGSRVFTVEAGLTVIFGLFGIVLLWLQRRQTAFPFVLVCVLFPLPYYISHAEYRYRLTLDPLLLALSAYALLSIHDWVRQRRRVHKAIEANASSPSRTVMVTRSFLSDQRGQAVVVAAVCIVVLVACLGLAVDVGHLRYEKRRLQQAADAAALSAGLEFTLCGTSHNCTAMQNAAKTASTENGYTPAAIALNCASSTNTGVVLTVNNPSCATGNTDSNNGNPSYVEVELSENVSTYFAQVLGFSSFPVSVRAESGRAAAPCIYALDQRPLLSVLPLGGIPLNNGITVVGLASVKAQCPIVDESTSLLDFNCALGSVSATKIAVTGTNSLDLLCPVTPTPQFNSPTPTPADPLAYVLQNHPLPIPNNCPALSTTVQILDATPRVFTDGTVFCGGLIIGAVANVTFQPGVYTFAPGNLLGVAVLGGLTITAGAHVTGNGVTFYNVGPNLAVTGGITIAGNVGPLGSISLIAPNNTNTVTSTINYQGLLFIQDPNDTAPAVIAASTAYNTTLEGAFYFPKAAVTYAVAGNAKFNILVAYDINFGVVTGGNTAYEDSVFGNNYSQLTSGSPIPATASVLVQ